MFMQLTAECNTIAQDEWLQLQLGVAAAVAAAAVLSPALLMNDGMHGMLGQLGLQPLHPGSGMYLRVYGVHVDNCWLAVTVTGVCNFGKSVPCQQ